MAPIREDDDTGRYQIPPFDDTPTRRYKTPTFCPACQGEGKISVEQESLGGYLWKMCNLCKGTGILR